MVNYWDLMMVMRWGREKVMPMVRSTGIVRAIEMELVKCWVRRWD
jgi:hypothetical protein